MITQDDIDAFADMMKEDANISTRKSKNIEQECDGMKIVEPFNSSLTQTQYGEQP